MVVVDDSSLQADSQPKSGDLVWRLAAAWHCSTFMKWTELLSELSQWPGHDDSTINIILVIIIIIITHSSCTHLRGSPRPAPATASKRADLAWVVISL